MKRAIPAPIPINRGTGRVPRSGAEGMYGTYERLPEPGEAVPAEAAGEEPPDTGVAAGFCTFVEGGEETADREV